MQKLLLPAGETENPTTMANKIIIVEMDEAPPLLKDIIINQAEGIVDTVVIGAHMEMTEGFIGTYTPEDNTMYIDIGNIVTQFTHYNQGMMYLANVWYSMIWAVGHELTHAEQFIIEPELLKFDNLPQEYEDQANKAGDKLVILAAHHLPVPSIYEMGWAGKNIELMLNTRYPHMIELTDEPIYISHGAAAELDTALAHFQDYDALDRQEMINDIDLGKMGVKINDRYFLTAIEYLNL